MDWALEVQLSISLTDFTCGELDVFYKDVPKLPIFPLSIIRSTAHLHPDDAAELKTKLYRPLKIAGGLAYGLYAGAAFFGAVGLISLYMLYSRRRGKPNKQKEHV